MEKELIKKLYILSLMVKEWNDCVIEDLKEEMEILKKIEGLKNEKKKLNEWEAIDD